MGEYVKGPRLSPVESEARLDEMRNKVAKKMNKWADRVQVSMAFKPRIERQDGERWEADGHTYEMKNGTARKMSIMEAARIPVWCPKCSKAMNHRFDTKFYYLRGWCYDCNIKWEGQLRIDGKWEEFEKTTMRENEKSFLCDKIQEHLDYIRNFTVPQLHFEDGRWESLAVISDFEGLFTSLEKDVEFMLARLDVINKEEELENANTIVVE